MSANEATQGGGLAPHTEQALINRKRSSFSRAARRRGGVKAKPIRSHHTGSQHTRTVHSYLDWEAFHEQENKKKN